MGVYIVSQFDDISNDSPWCSAVESKSVFYSSHINFCQLINNGILCSVTENAKKSLLSRKQKEQMTQLLIAVIVEFAEPYFARMARHRQLERRKLLLLQHQQQKQKKQAQQQTREKKKVRRSVGKNALQDEKSSSSGFDERAVSWATSCLKQLLQPPPVTHNTNNASSTNNNNNDGHHPPPAANNDTHIPELDALLAASGPHDGMETERRMQSALMCGLQGRRLLQTMGM